MVEAQAPALSPRVLQAFDSLATATRTARVEAAACVAGTATAIDSLTPATFIAADSETVYTDGTPYCPFGVAFVHTHLHVASPSPLDRRTKLRSGAPFALILVVTDSSWQLVLY